MRRSVRASARARVVDRARAGCCCGRASRPRRKGRCDRACLIGIAEQYLDALVAKDPKKAPLASNVKYTENGQRLQLGDGFWNSVAGKGTYKLHVADPTAGQIVTFIDDARGGQRR